MGTQHSHYQHRESPLNIHTATQATKAATMQSTSTGLEELETHLHD